ncbi:MAG: ABC transporter ATP-binding protein [Syntrophomonadaceae bacterium]
MYDVDVRGLNKWYGSLKAVDNVSFKVQSGTSFGLLGLNGAGKTTTFKMMVSLIRPDSGTALIAGRDVVKEPMLVRRNIGYVAENPAFYTRMTTLEILRYICRLLDVPVNEQVRRIDYALELVGLMNKKNALVGTYSRGMRHRLGLAQALLSEPRVLFLDEPTLGLDPLGARNMRELILRLRVEKQLTVLMSSHVLPEVESICDVVGIFDHGRLVAVDTIENLRSTAGDSVNLEMLLTSPAEAVVPALKSIPGVNFAESSGPRIYINTAQDQEIRTGILQEAIKNGAQILSFGPRESSLEDILLRLVQTDVSDLPEPKKSLLPDFITSPFRSGNRS